MVHLDPNSRPSAKRPCTYWDGEQCTATNTFAEEEITCYHEGNCDGFGTCRGCSKYEQGGLKYGTPDGDGGTSQTPMNLQLYNIRAKVKPCCFWDGDPEDFSKGVLGLNPNYTSEHLEATVSGANDTPTSCTLSAAAPWQIAFTEENPTAYGCNGAKTECPYYTGPKFTELVDAKMDTGDRITAKQVLELRFYSTDWSAFVNPREQYEKRFENPDIWAWASSEPSTSEQLFAGRLDEFSQPLVQEVRIKNLTADTPEFIVGGPKTATTGTPTIGQPPKFPDLIRELDDAAVGLEVIWPRKTTFDEPFTRKTFTQEEMFQWIAVQINSDREAIAINLTKHPQFGDTDAAFVTNIKQNYPADVILDIQTSLPGSTFPVPLVLDGETDTINHIRIFLETGAADGSMLTADVYVRHIFYHAEVAQTSFIDKYGHPQVDPWVNHFTDITITADFKHLTSNTSIHDVLWNTTASNGKKTIYAVEKSKTSTSEASNDSGDVLWEPVGCGAVVVTLTDPVINRVYPWRAWGADSKGNALEVTVDRSGHDSLAEGQPTEVVLEFLFASTKGTAIAPNVAVYRLPLGESIQPLDRDKDVITVRYVYTEYKQGPIDPEDVVSLKFPSDVTKVIEALVYDVDNTDTAMTVAGTFVKVGDARVRSCEEIIGDCYTEKSFENEGTASTVFFAGGVNEFSIKTVGQMHTECREEFDSKYLGKQFPDGTDVSFSEVVNKLTNIALEEGSQHYNVVFSDEDGRPVGTKRVGFLTQSTIVQARDVEIKYQWGAHMQHYPTRPIMLVFATFHEPTFATRERLIKVIYQYEPFCGDHSPTDIGNNLFTPYNIETDSPGVLWYPYKQCVQPRYYRRVDEWWGPVNYDDPVEGFDTQRRRYYWERMRFFDQYTPSIMNAWGQIGCFFSEYTTTANAHRPVVFTGYTKIRSDHVFGAYATDRESVRISRHWEKRNLAATEEIVKQEEGGLTIELTDEYKAVLYDEEGNLREGAETATPVWMHISDDFSVVKPTTEDIVHPFGRYLLNNVGSYQFNEAFSDTRKALSDTFEDRDYTSNAARATDGSVVHITAESFANNASGELENDPGDEVRWVFTNQENSWAWLASPPEPDRDTALNSADSGRITGLHLTNVGPTFFKKNKKSATHPVEGSHTVRYLAHQFTVSGTIDFPANISMDGGPEWNISQTDGLLYILEGSPYLSEEHADEEYDFALLGNGPGGIGLLADNRGLQFFEVAGEKAATYAGINMSLLFDINELPHRVVDINRIDRFSDGSETSIISKVEEFSREYPETERAPQILELNFSGHYYVEEVIIDFTYGKPSQEGQNPTPIVDIPVIEISGLAKVDGVATVSGTEASPIPAEELVFATTAYTSGAAVEVLKTERRSFGVRQRLFTLDISLGARNKDRRTIVDKVQVIVREHTDRVEAIYTYEPRVQTSNAQTGTHKPSDLEFYFQRSTPDFAKNYQNGQISLADLNPGNYSVTKIPGTEVKWLGRQVKDLIPMFNFTNFEGLFPYDNIDISQIPNYTEGTSPANQELKYLDTPVLTSSKGWTLATSKHYTDPSSSSVSTDSGPDGVPNVTIETWPNEDLQKYLYDHAAEQLGNTAIYSSFWHPAEKEFFEEQAGINLDDYSWELSLTSTPAPIDRVYRSSHYGCDLQTTNEDLDGFVHRLPTWQAKGVFHYLCDPRYSWACLAVVMNKCNEFLFQSYGKAEYLDNNVVDRFSYKFEFPPKDRMAYKSRGLYNQNEEGGFIGGTGGISASAASAPFPPLNQVKEKYQSELYITGENKYQ